MVALRWEVVPQDNFPDHRPGIHYYRPQKTPFHTQLMNYYYTPEVAGQGPHRLAPTSPQVFHRPYLLAAQAFPPREAYSAASNTIAHTMRMDQQEVQGNVELPRPHPALKQRHSPRLRYFHWQPVRCEDDWARAHSPHEAGRHKERVADCPSVPAATSEHREQIDQQRHVTTRAARSGPQKMRRATPCLHHSYKIELDLWGGKTATPARGVLLAAVAEIAKARPCHSAGGTADPAHAARVATH